MRTSTARPPLWFFSFVITETLDDAYLLCTSFLALPLNRENENNSQWGARPLMCRVSWEKHGYAGCLRLKVSRLVPNISPRWWVVIDVGLGMGFS